MSIVFLVLKIIGIILLTVIGIAVLLILLVSFVPVRYRIFGNVPKKADTTVPGVDDTGTTDGDTESDDEIKNAADEAEHSDENIHAEVKVSWLLHLVRVRAYYDDEIKYLIKVLFFTIKKSDNLLTEKQKEKNKRKEEKKLNRNTKEKHDNKEKKSEDKKTTEKSAVKNINAGDNPEKISDVKFVNDSDKDITDNHNAEPDDGAAGKTEAFDDDLSAEDGNTAEEFEEKKTIFEKIVFILEKLADFIINIKDKLINAAGKLSDIWHNIEYYSDLLEDETNQAAFKKALNVIGKVLKSIAPRKIKGNVHIGSKDPYTMGKMMSIYSVLLPIIHDKIQVVPEYDEDVISGDLNMRGRITVFEFIKVLYVYFFNKDIKHLKKALKRES